MRHHCILIVASLLFSSLGIVQASGDINDGKLKAAACEGCHGLNSNNPLAPKLAGQPQRYLVQQLLNFKNGNRKDPIMNGIVATLPDQNAMESVAAYYASLPYPATFNERTPIILEMGKMLYKNQCAMCHKDQGDEIDNRGLPADTTAPAADEIPLIRNQPKQYLVKTLKDFRSGQRKSNDYMVMDEIAKRLTDKQIDSVAKYLSHRPKSPFSKRKMTRISWNDRNK